MQTIFAATAWMRGAQPRRRRCGLACLLALLMALVGMSVIAKAQVQNDGTVMGRVTDIQGRVVTDADITLVSPEQGRRLSLRSNSAGEYVFNSVPVGTYTLRVSAPNFATYVVERIDVHAAGSVAINPVLKPGAVQASVTVTARSNDIDTHSAVIGVVIDHTLIDNLPVDGNNVVTMAALLPGVTDVNAPTTYTSNIGGPTYNISGSRNNQNLMLLDGSIWNNLSNNTGLNFPAPQALQEVSVLMNGYKAEYGRNTGSIFNVITRSGSDATHGSVWEYAQNRVLNAADYISKANPALVQNQFGATLGGAIHKAKLFYFVEYQDLRMAATVVAQAQTLTLNQRGLENDGVTPYPCQTPAYGSSTCANFAEDQVTTWANPVYGKNASQEIQNLNAAYAQQTGGSPTATSPCVALLLTQPATLPYPEIPEVCWNPVTRALAALTPVPTLSIAGANPYAVSSQKEPRNDMQGLVRIDREFGRHSISARYYETAANDATANGVKNGQGVASYGVNNNTAALHFGNISDTWVLTGNLLNVMRVGYKRYDYQITPQDKRTLSSFGADFTQPGDSLPRITLNGRTGYVLGSSNNYDRTVDEGVQFDDMLSWSHGRHNFQTGLEYLRLQYLNRAHSTPYFSFSNDLNENDPAMLYVLGIPYGIMVYNGANQAAIQHDLYTYVQDDWRILPRLTLNLGLRWEIPFTWYQPDGEAATFIPGYQSKVFPESPANLAFVGDQGIKKSLVGTSFNNFAPRVGFADDLFGNGSTVVRGGFGIFYDAINAQMVGISAPYHFYGDYVGPVGGISIPLLDLNPVPPDYVRGQPVTFTSPYSITFPDKNFRTPYTMGVNFGVEQSFSSSSTIEANYVGRFSRHLALGYDLNPAIYDCSGAYFQINPAVYCTDAAQTQASYEARVKYHGFNYGGGGALDYMTEGFADYNSLQVIYIHREPKWLSVTASYTFSKSIDDSSSTGIGNSSDQPSISVHRAVSDFNSRQILNMGYFLHYSPMHRPIRLVRAIANGWGLSGMYSARTGHPFSVYTAADASLRDELSEYDDIVPEGYAPLNSHRSRQQKISEWFNTASFTSPSKGDYGDAPRNFLTGPAYISNNMALQRTFPLSRGGKTLNFRVDAFNVFNTPNLGQPVATQSGLTSKNDNYGVILSTLGGNGAVGTNGRRLQLSAVVKF